MNGSLSTSLSRQVGVAENLRFARLQPVATGSACAAGRDEPSHVLLACGLAPELAQTSVRFSLSRRTTAEELAAAADALRASVVALAD